MLNPFLSIPVLTSFIVITLSACAIQAPVKQPELECAVIAHRGSSAYLPEHTAPAYERAIREAADFIEPDVIVTQDGVAVVRHESVLGLTTDVASRPEFADRQRTQMVGKTEYTDWFSEDFTAAEYATLHATERYPELRPQSARLNGRFPVANLQQVIDLWQSARNSTGRDIGLYPEIKQPAYFAERGLDSVQIIINTLEQNGLTGPDDDVLLQSFDPEALKRASGMTDLPLVQLLRGKQPPELAAAVSPEAMAEIAAYADGIAVPKGLVYARADETSPRELTDLVQNAHAAGLFVHVYTFRAENKYLPPEFKRPDQSSGDLQGHITEFLDVGIDGFFTDNPDIGRVTCDERAAL